MLDRYNGFMHGVRYKILTLSIVFLVLLYLRQTCVVHQMSSSNSSLAGDSFLASSSAKKEKRKFLEVVQKGVESLVCQVCAKCAVAN